MFKILNKLILLISSFIRTYSRSESTLTDDAHSEKSAQALLKYQFPDAYFKLGDVIFSQNITCFSTVEVDFVY